MLQAEGKNLCFKIIKFSFQAYGLFKKVLQMAQQIAGPTGLKGAVLILVSNFSNIVGFTLSGNIYDRWRLSRGGRKINLDIKITFWLFF